MLQMRQGCWKMRTYSVNAAHGAAFPEIYPQSFKNEIVTFSSENSLNSIIKT